MAAIPPHPYDRQPKAAPGQSICSVCGLHFNAKVHRGQRLIKDFVPEDYPIMDHRRFDKENDPTIMLVPNRNGDLQTVSCTLTLEQYRALDNGTLSRPRIGAGRKGLID